MATERQPTTAEALVRDVAAEIDQAHLRGDDVGSRTLQHWALRLKAALSAMTRERKREDDG